jgi:hypothetical protein
MKNGNGLTGVESKTLPSGDKDSSEFGKHLLAFGLVLGLSWLGLYLLWDALPHVRAGHQQIYEYKLAAIEEEDILPTDAAPIRIVIFGNSRVQAGFIPELFDQHSGGLVYSYNLGLPATSAFLDTLRTLVSREHKPTHILLTLPWPDQDHEPLGQYLRQDNRIINGLFPFRHLLRDLIQFSVRSYQNGGLLSYYDHMAKLVDQARRDRGYFFIENQSHFPGHRLPDDFHVDSERPDVSWKRNWGRRGEAFQHLLEIAEEEEIGILVVPSYYREYSFAEPELLKAESEALAEHGITLLGPDYWRYPNRLFSDPTHVNRDGAKVYTRHLWELVGPHLLADPRARLSTPEKNPSIGRIEE